LKKKGTPEEMIHRELSVLEEDIWRQRANVKWGIKRR
jgi:hypothetical protein